MFVARRVALFLTILWLWPSSLHAQSESYNRILTGR